MYTRQVIALDVGGTSVKSAIVVPGGHVRGKPTVTPIDSRTDAETILSTLSGIVRHHLAQAEGTDLLGIALGFPGPFDYATGVCWIKDVEKYEALYGLNIGEELRARLDVGDRPILFRNDAEAAIVGEALYGAGQGLHRLIGVTLGTGCGSAFIADGEPVTSGEGVPPNGWLYPIPFRGVRADDCFSERGLAARLRAAGTPVSSVQEAATAARQGDPTTRQVWGAFGTDLGTFLNPFVRTFGAQAVLVLGGIAKAFDLFGSALQRTLSVPALRGKRGEEAALLGAAELVFRLL